MHRMKRFGILTGGGDAPGLNAVLRAVVKTAAHAGSAEIIGIEDGYDGLVLPDRACAGSSAAAAPSSAPPTVATPSPAASAATART
jgi:hypothetical protein